MTVYSVKTTGIHMKNSLASAVESANNGDEIRLGNTNIGTDNGVGIDKPLYISGKKNSQILVNRHNVGLYLSNGANLSLTQVDLKMQPQSNAIATDPNTFTGSLELYHVTTIQSKSKNQHDYWPALNIQSGQKLKIDSSNIGSIQLIVPNMDVEIVNSTIGELGGSATAIQCRNLTVQNSTISNAQIGTTGNTARYNSLFTDGDLEFYGNFEINNFKFIPKEYQSLFGNKLPKFVPETVVPFSVNNGQGTIKGLDVLPDAHADNQKVISPNYSGIIIGDSEVTIENGRIGLQNQPNSLMNSNITLLNVEDLNNGWIKDDASHVTEQNTNGVGGNVDDSLTKLDNLTGLANAKRQIKEFINLANINRQRVAQGLQENNGFSLHMIFQGNAGTGKTTVARLFGQALFERGILPTAKFVEVTRKDLVGEHVGETAPKTAAVCESAYGGVLFIDEAYALTPENAGNDFGSEAIAELIAQMENNRDNLVVILAGYTTDMNRFLQINQGLSSRIPNRVTFDDYNSEEIIQIVEMNLNNAGNTYDRPTLEQVLPRVYEQLGNSGNGRWARNFTQALSIAQSSRLAQYDINSLTPDQLAYINVDDMKEAVQRMMDNYNAEQSFNQ